MRRYGRGRTTLKTLDLCDETSRHLGIKKSEEAESDLHNELKILPCGLLLWMLNAPPGSNGLIYVSPVVFILHNL